MVKPGQGIRTFVGVSVIMGATVVMFYGLRHLGGYKIAAEAFIRSKARLSRFHTKCSSLSRIPSLSSFHQLQLTSHQRL